MKTVTPPFPPRFRTFRDSSSGVAAVEFAVILPGMLLLYIGVVDVTRGVIASRKLNYLSRTISDLVSQQQTTQAVPITTLSTILTASSAIMQPYGTSGLTITVSAVDIAAKKNTTTCCDALVRWTYTQGGTLRNCSPALNQVPNGTKPALDNIPAAVVSANQTFGASNPCTGYNYSAGQTSYIIITDVSFTYKPMFVQALSWFSPGMSKTTYMVPRASSGPVTIADPSTAPTGQSGTICF